MNAALEAKSRTQRKLLGETTVFADFLDPSSKIPVYEVQELGQIGPSASTLALLTPAENAAKKQRAKRRRWFIVEFRLTPSKLGEYFRRTATDWEPDPFGDYRTLAEARYHINVSPASDPGYFTRGTEYRVRRKDTKVTA